MAWAAAGSRAKSGDVGEMRLKKEHRLITGCRAGGGTPKTPCTVAIFEFSQSSEEGEEASAALCRTSAAL
jgi:hypothetical protein